MAITHNASGFTADSFNTSASVSLTIASGTDTYLHVVVLALSTVTGVTWNGTAMTAGDVRTISGVRKAYHFGMAAPDTGAHSVVATMSGPEYLAVLAVAADGVSQTSNIRGYAEAIAGATSTYSLTPAGNVTGDLLLCILSDYSYNAGTFSAASGSTQVGGTSVVTGTAYRITTGDTQSVGLSWSWSGGEAVLQACAVALIPSGGGGGSSPSALRRKLLLGVG